MRLLGILNVAASGLKAHQVAIRTAGHNISNVNTEGYSRQRVTLVPVHPQPAPRGYQLGGGVLATDLRGLRDEFVERQLVTEQGHLGAAEARQRPLQRMDALFNELNGEGVHQAMERFFNELRDLHANPESLDHRAGVRSAAEIFTERIRNTATALENLRLDLNSDIQDQITEINRLSAEVANLNDRIAAIEAGGQEASDFRDRRQLALTELGSRIAITTFEDADGRTVVVGPGGKPLVEDGTAAVLESEPENPSGLLRVIHVSGNNRRVDITADVSGGALHGLLQARDTDIAGTQDDLNSFVFRFVEFFNQHHRQHFDEVDENAPLGVAPDPPYDALGLDNVGNRNFFTPLAAEQDAARGFSVDDLILNGDDGLRAIAAAVQVDPAVAVLPGDNRNAIALSDLQHDPTFFGGRATPGEELARIVRDVGSADRNNDFDIEFQDIKVAQLENLRDTVAGVSLDEEMLDLVKFQNAFQASSRVVRIVDEMLEDVINLKR